MDFDNVPDIKSLVSQEAICFTGHKHYIKTFYDLLRSEYEFAEPTPIESGERVELSLEPIVRPYPDSLETNFDMPELPSSISVPIDEQALYHIHLGDDFELSALVHSSTGIERKLMYRKSQIGNRKALQALRDIHSELNTSQVFTICPKCHLLVAASLSGHESRASASDCDEHFVQPYDVSQMDRVTDRKKGKVWARKTAHGIEIYLSEVIWIHPHEWAYRDRLIQVLPRGTVPALVREAKSAIYHQCKPSRICGQCGYTGDAAFFFNEDTCHECATKVYAVRY